MSRTFLRRVSSAVFCCARIKRSASAKIKCAHSLRLLSTGGTNPFRDQVWSDTNGKSEDLFGDVEGVGKPEGEDFVFDTESIPINVLTSLEEYEELVESGDNYVIHFTAPWSEGCKSFIPLFFHASQNPDFNIKVSFNAVDITQHTDIATAAGVTEVPTVAYGMGYDAGHKFAGADSKRFLRVLSALNGDSPEKLATISNHKLDKDYVERQSRKKMRKRSLGTTSQSFERSDEDVFNFMNAFKPFRRMFGTERPEICGITGLHTDDIPELQLHEIPDIESIDLNWSELDLNSKEDMLRVVEVMKGLKAESTRHERARAERRKAHRKGTGGVSD